MKEPGQRRSRDEILAERTRVLAEKAEAQAKLISCNEQIQQAKRDAYQGTYSDPAWFRSVNFARNRTAARVQELAHRLTKLRVELKDSQREFAAKQGRLPTEAEKKQLTKALWAVAVQAQALRSGKSDEDTERRLDAALLMLTVLRPGWEDPL